MKRSYLLATVVLTACGTTSGDLLTDRDAGPSAPRDAGVSTADAGATTADAGSPDAGSTAPDAGPQVDCSLNPPLFPEFDRTCQTVADCSLGMRQVDCCGSILVTSFARSEEQSFTEAAELCRTQYPACQCAPRATVADDGTMDEGFMAVATCVNQMCTSSFPSPINCGAETCNPTFQICVRRNGGPVGDVFECAPVPNECIGSRSCSCVGATICVAPFDGCIDIDSDNIRCE